MENSRESHINESERNLQYCMNQMKSKNPDYNSDEFFYAVKYLLTFKKNNISKDEAVFIIKTISERKKSKIINLQQASLDIEIETDPVKYKKECKKRYKFEPIAICRSEDYNKYRLIFSPQVISFIRQPYYCCKLYGLATIPHELKHVDQLLSIENNLVNGRNAKRTSQEYILALENMSYNLCDRFYKVNYDSFFTEQQAIKTGYLEAFEIIDEFAKEEFPNYLKEYRTDISEGENNFETQIKKRVRKYKILIENDFKTNKLIRVGRKLFSQEHRIKIQEQLAHMYIKMDPQILEEYPILKLAFNPDGSRKNIKQLFSEREQLLLDRSSVKTEVDDLYTTIIAERFADNYDQEIAQLQAFMQYKNESEARFYDNLIKNREQQKNAQTHIIKKSVDSAIRPTLLLNKPRLLMSILARKMDRKSKKRLADPNYGSGENR